MFTTIMSNNGTGIQFGKSPRFVGLGLLAVLLLSQGVALGGLDGDGNLDAVFANVGQRNRVCLGAGAGGFTSCSDVSTDSNSSFGVALEPRPTSAALDHFKCYKAKGASLDVLVSLVDQFGVEPEVLVGKPKLFCNPVDKNDEGISNPEAHLTC